MPEFGCWAREDAGIKQTKLYYRKQKPVAVLIYLEDYWKHKQFLE